MFKPMEGFDSTFRYILIAAKRAQHYPDDFAELALTHVLALYCACRIDEAAAALRTAAVEHTRAVKTLLAEQAKQPKSGGFGIAIGGAEEAWLYREAHRELWSERGALGWAAEVLAQWRPRRVRSGGKPDRDQPAQTDKQIELPLSRDS